MFLSLVLLADPASAYPMMVRHGYTGCAQCHFDPSGGGALTEYGRGQAEILLATRWKDHGPEWEPGKEKDFAFGVVDLPDALTLQFEGRSLAIPEPSNFRYIVMVADLRAGLDLGPLRAYASAGYASEGAFGARVTSNDTGGNLVSREYWLGFDVAKGLLVRAGRIALPFGMRSEEHTLFARQLTRTDLNDTQQVGLDAVFDMKRLRAEVMAIAGNFQLSPGMYRERGYSALLAYAPHKTAEVGLSSLVTHAARDVDTGEPRTRQAHGLFGRYAPVPALVLMGEEDLLVDKSPTDSSRGFAGFLQADVEVAQGVHVRGTGEWCDADFGDGSGVTATGWLTGQWYFTAHADVRADLLYGSLSCVVDPVPQPMGLVQFHVFL